MVVEYHDGGDHAGGDHEHDAVEVGAWSGKTYNTDLALVTNCFFDFLYSLVIYGKRFKSYFTHCILSFMHSKVKQRLII